MFRILLTACFALGLMGLTMAQDKTYTLKTYVPKDGDVFEEKNKRVDKGTNTVTIMGNTMKSPIETGSETEFVEKIIKMDPKKKIPSQGERSYKVAKKRGPMDTEMSSGIVEGKTVTFQSVDGKLKFTLDGKDITAEKLGEFGGEFESRNNAPQSQEMLPEKAIKVGESWKLNQEKVMKPLFEIFKKGVTIDEAKATGNGKLIAVFDKAGVPYGKLQYVFELPLKTLVNGNMDLEAGSQVLLTMTIETPIDGTKGPETVRSETKTVIHAKLPNNAGDIKVDLDGTNEEIRTPVKK
ncbi:MAG: hypothetical protein ACRC8S_01715 [Fimbriiglobus sp.]